MKKVIGIGGIFFKANNPETLKQWYAQHLGFDITDYGVQFEHNTDNAAQQNATTIWAPFKADTNYFAPSTKDFMINFRVNNLEELVQELKQADVTILDEIATYDYGKFVHIVDIEGNKLELWEPA